MITLHYNSFISEKCIYADSMKDERQEVPVSIGDIGNLASSLNTGTTTEAIITFEVSQTNTDEPPFVVLVLSGSRPVSTIIIQIEALQVDVSVEVQLKQEDKFYKFSDELFNSSRPIELGGLEVYAIKVVLISASPSTQLTATAKLSVIACAKGEF